MVSAEPTTHSTQVESGFLKATGLCKSFDGALVVEGVSFSIGRQEIFGLLGPNGAGKTTTIRMLSTVLAPDAGDVTIGGHSVLREADEVRKVIGVCPQELALYQELSARDNLVFFGRMAGLGRREAKDAAAENLELVGLLDRASDAVRKFSGGMKRRVNIAVALMSRPELLFLDEPTVGVDPHPRSPIHDPRPDRPSNRHPPRPLPPTHDPHLPRRHEKPSRPRPTGPEDPRHHPRPGPRTLRTAQTPTRDHPRRCPPCLLALPRSE